MAIFKQVDDKFPCIYILTFFFKLPDNSVEYIRKENRSWEDQVGCLSKEEMRVSTKAVMLKQSSH